MDKQYITKSELLNWIDSNGLPTSEVEADLFKHFRLDKVDKDSPQEAPQVKSVEALYKLMVDECPFVIRPSIKSYVIEAIKLYAAPFQSRIAELEAEKKIVSDWLQESNAMVLKMEKQCSVYKEALELMCMDYEERGKTYADAYLIGKKALNKKEVET